MPEIRVLFWDIGGVLLTDGWDGESRCRAAEQFGLDREDFERRHEHLALEFEAGRLSLDAYLKSTVFYEPRTFTPDDFKAFVFAQSRPYPEALALAEQVSRSERYLMAALNNESLELNQYRIERFGLRRYFCLFFSSCYLGVTKPDGAIYRMVLQMTQCAPEECLFIDDRLPNLEPAKRFGLQTIHYQDVTQLRGDLERAGVVGNSRV